MLSSSYGPSSSSTHGYSRDDDNYPGHHRPTNGMGKRLLNGGSNSTYGDPSHHHKRYRDDHHQGIGSLSRSHSTSSTRNIIRGGREYGSGADGGGMTRRETSLPSCLPESYHRSACLLILAEFRRLSRSNALDQRKALWSMYVLIAAYYATTTSGRTALSRTAATATTTNRNPLH